MRSAPGQQHPLKFVALAFILLAFGFLLGRGTVPEGSDQVPQALPSPSETSRPVETALEAATRYSRVVTGPSGDVETYLAEVADIAVPDFSERATELATNAVNFVEARYGPGGNIEFYPVRYRVASESATEATVEVWGLALGFGPNIRGIEESWATGTFELLLVDSEWKVAGQRSVAGPTPELLRAEDEFSVIRILEDFQGYEDAPDL